MVTYITDLKSDHESYSLESARAFAIARLKRMYPKQMMSIGECIEGKVTFYKETKTGRTLVGFMYYTMDYYTGNEFRWGNKWLDEHGKIKR